MTNDTPPREYPLGMQRRYFQVRKEEVVPILVVEVKANIEEVCMNCKNYLIPGETVIVLYMHDSVLYVHEHHFESGPE